MSRVADENVIEDAPKLPFMYAYLLGFAMKIGTISVTWNLGLTGGFYEFFVCFLVISSAYFCLCLCMCEMVSIMSFSGGYYGYARCAIGPFGGFLVGCSGAWESMVYLSVFVLRLGMAVQFIWEDKYDLKKYDLPFIWMILYGILLIIQVSIFKYFWKTVAFLSICCILLILILLFGSMEHGDFHKYALHGTNGFQQTNEYWTFLSVFRMPMMFYLGFDMITLTASDVENSKKNIPKVMLMLYFTLFIFATVLIFAICSNAPGLTSKLYSSSATIPTAHLYSQLFDISLKMATIVSSVFPFVSAIAYMFIVSRQLKSMATSGLLPPIFKWTIWKEEFPFFATFFVTVFAFFVNYFCYHEGLRSMTSRLATMGGSFVYLAMFYCFIVFRLRFGHLERGFRNPLGIFSAIYGILIFLAIISILFYFKETLYFPASSFYGCYIGLMIVYYYLYAESHQCFSASEQKVFFKAYILNMQIRKKKAIHRRFASDMISLVLAPILPASFRNTFSAIRNRDSLNSANDRKSNISHNSHNSINSVDSNIKKVKAIYCEDSHALNDASIAHTAHDMLMSERNTSEDLKVDQDLDKPIQPIHST